MYFGSAHFTISEDEVIILLLLGLECNSKQALPCEKKTTTKNYESTCTCISLSYHLRWHKTVISY